MDGWREEGLFFQKGLQIEHLFVWLSLSLVKLGDVVEENMTFLIFLTIRVTHQKSQHILPLSPLDLSFH